MDIFHH